ncbi:hypothetical protein P0E66_15340, partial [Enterococcus faecalis]|nr:hypothetical protein [Enterococcus faecalis]
AQHSTAQHSTAQHSTAQHSTLNKRVYLTCTKTELLIQTQAFSLINEKVFLLVVVKHLCKHTKGCGINA